jgi:hypothetical protein
VIVNSLQDGWEVIYQRSHAHLAATLVAAWRIADRVPNWTDLIIATAQHDDQEMFWHEVDHLTEIGAPMDFAVAELNTRRIQAQLVIDNAHRQGTLIALLISLHNSFLYERMRGQDKQLDSFLDRQRKDQKAWLRQLKWSQAEATKAYAFIRWADRMSLILCRRELPDRERALEVEPTPDGNMVQVRLRDDGSLCLDPWVFEEDRITASIEARRLKQLKFESEQELRRALDKAKIEVREWEFRRED